MKVCKPCWICYTVDSKSITRSLLPVSQTVKILKRFDSCGKKESLLCSYVYVHKTKYCEVIPPFGDPLIANFGQFKYSVECYYYKSIIWNQRLIKYSPCFIYSSKLRTYSVLNKCKTVSNFNFDEIKSILRRKLCITRTLEIKIPTTRWVRIDCLL